MQAKIFSICLMALYCIAGAVCLYRLAQGNYPRNTETNSQDDALSLVVNMLLAVVIYLCLIK